MARLFNLLLFITAVTGQFTVDPPTTAPSDTIRDCTNWLVSTGSETCQAVADENFLSLSELYRYNPSLSTGCNFVKDVSYCIEENWGIPPPTSSSTSASSTPSTTSGNGITTPTPTQTGMAKNCNKFHFVAEGQSCADVLALYSLTLDTFYSWNQGVGPQCNTMWSRVYVCVGFQGPSSTTSVPTTSTAPGNGIVTPTPTQPGMIASCNKFHFVEEGQSCADVLALYSLSEATFYSWNQGAGAQCNNMWAKVYVCVGVIGGGGVITSTSSRTSSTTAGNGIATPTPTQPGMIRDCDKFDFVKEGENCDTILTRNKITVAQLYAWNSGVGENCNNLWAKVYVCVHKIGAPTGSPTTVKTSSTTTGNGIATPTPSMPGMVGNCRRFYKVVDGDNCDKIVTKTGASKANIIKWNAQVGASCNVWLGYYICVGV